MKEQINITPAYLKQVLAEYEYDDDIMCDEDERVHKIKKALTKLQDPDRILFCLYLDQGASRKVGKILGVSHSTILKEINRIKDEIRYIILCGDE